jgi:hypothetical protein
MINVQGKFFFKILNKYLKLIYDRNNIKTKTIQQKENLVQ